MGDKHRCFSANGLIKGRIDLIFRDRVKGCGRLVKNNKNGACLYSILAKVMFCALPPDISVPVSSNDLYRIVSKPSIIEDKRSATLRRQAVSHAFFVVLRFVGYICPKLKRKEMEILKPTDTKPTNCS